MSKKKVTKSNDWDDVYMDMVDKMKKNTKEFPNAMPIDKEEKLEKKKVKEAKKKKHNTIYGTGSMGWGFGLQDYDSNGAGDYGGGDGGGDGGGGE